jgi:hypothetical protein
MYKVCVKRYPLRICHVAVTGFPGKALQDFADINGEKVSHHLTQLILPLIAIVVRGANSDSKSPFEQGCLFHLFSAAFRPRFLY